MRELLSQAAQRRAQAAAERAAAQAAAELEAQRVAEQAAAELEAERAAADLIEQQAAKAVADRARILAEWQGRRTGLRSLATAAAATADALLAYEAATLTAERATAEALLREASALEVLAGRCTAAETAHEAATTAVRALDETRRAARVAVAQDSSFAAEVEARTAAESAAISAQSAAVAAFDALSAAQLERAGAVAKMRELAAPEIVSVAELQRRISALPCALAAVDAAFAKAVDASLRAMSDPGCAAELKTEAQRLGELSAQANLARDAVAVAAAAAAGAAASDTSAEDALAAAAQSERRRAVLLSLQQQIKAADAAKEAKERKADIKMEYKSVRGDLLLLEVEKNKHDDDAWSDELEQKYEAKKAALNLKLESFAEQTRNLEPQLTNTILAECFPELLLAGNQVSNTLTDALFTKPFLAVPGTRHIYSSTWVADPAAAQVCLKVFPGAGKSREFQQESRRMKSLVHPLIIALRGEYVRPNGDGVLVLPFYPAGDLRSWFDELAAKKGSLTTSDWAEARHVLRQLLHALSFLHARRIAHRDVKPENLLWSDREERSIVVTDFGIARDFNRQLETTRMLGAGTVGYAAPEANTSDWKAVPWAADMWAFGVMTLHIATGEMWRWDPIRKALVQAAGSLFTESPSAGAAARDLIVLALSCLSVEPSARPSADEALQTNFFAAAVSPSDAVGAHAVTGSSELAPALAAKLGSLCSSLRELRNTRPKNDAGWQLELPKDGEPLCAALLAAVGNAAPVDLLRLWAVRLDGEEAPLSSAMHSFWTALPQVRLLEQCDQGASLDRAYLPRAGADRKQLQALGRVLAKCLLDGIAVDLELAPTLFATLLDTADAALLRPGTALAHLAAFDTDTASTHRNTLSTRHGAGSNYLTVGMYLDIDNDTPLTDTNKAALVCQKVRLILLESRMAELHSVKRGFEEVINAAGITSVLSVLTEWELGAQLSGATGFIDRADIRKRVAWSPDWPADDPQRSWLDQLLGSLSGPALRLLMVRAAERVRLPSSGASFTVMRSREKDSVPRLHGGGVLQLPATCPSFEAMSARLLNALGLDESAALRQSMDAQELLRAQRENIRILQQAGAVRPGAVYSCKCGAPYIVGNCGGAVVVGTCPVCRGPIGGAGHFTVAGNQLRTDIDGAEEAAWGHQGYRNVEDLQLS